MDAQVFWDRSGTCSCWHGVTTVVMGNCGFTLAPASRRAGARSWCATSSAPRTSPARRWPRASTGRWTTFAEYLDVVDALPKGINYAANIGHSALRTYVMGERAFTDAATADDLAAMEPRAARRAARGRLRVHDLADPPSRDVRRPSRRLAARLAGTRCASSSACHGRARRGDLPDRSEDPPSTRTRPGPRPADCSTWPSTPACRSRSAAMGTATGRASVLDLIDATAAAGGRTFGLTHCRGIGAMSSFEDAVAVRPAAGVAASCAAAPTSQGEAPARSRGAPRSCGPPTTAAYARAIGAEARKPDFERMQVLARRSPPNPLGRRGGARRAASIRSR